MLFVSVLSFERSRYMLFSLFDTRLFLEYQRKIPILSDAMLFVIMFLSEYSM